MDGKSAIETTDVPADFVVFSQLAIGSVEHRLGYFGDDPLVIVGYCAGGAEVIWKDGHRAGFGAGGWKIFLDEISPLALRCGINLGSIGSAGTHVLLIDRQQHRSSPCLAGKSRRGGCHGWGVTPLEVVVDLLT